MLTQQHVNPFLDYGSVFCLLVTVSVKCVLVSLFRHFNLRLKRDTSLFSPDLIIDVSGEEAPIDTSHIYSGEVFGESKHFPHYTS